jgi:hypothetical protein
MNGDWSVLRIARCRSLGSKLTIKRFTLRRATACDADAIANVFSASFRLLTFLPMLHTVEEDRWFITNLILKECDVTVAEDESGIVLAFLARQRARERRSGSYTRVLT